MSAKDALNRFYAKDMQRQEKERTGTPHRRNEKPEWEQTVKPCMKWFKTNGFSMTKVESKAVYCFQSGRYLTGQAEAGFSDAAGCTPDGIGAFIEFKAPGRRSNLSEGQRAFLMEKILKGAFAVVVDSTTCLEKIWIEFQSVRRHGKQMGVNLLLRHLPGERVPRRQEVSGSALPFE